MWLLFPGGMGGVIAERSVFMSTQIDLPINSHSLWLLFSLL